jgi:hypothetical protein
VDAVIAREQFRPAGERDEISLATRATGTRTYRRAAAIAGGLFIVGDIAGVLSYAVMGGLLDGPHALANVAAHPARLTLAALLILSMGLALAFVPVVLYPVFRRVDKAMAIGTIVLRGALETVGYLASVGALLLLEELGRDYAAGSAGAGATGLSSLLISVNGSVAAWLTAIAFSVGSLLYYSLFFKSRLVPRWLSAWCLVGSVLYLAWPLLAMFGHEAGLLMAPLAVGEIVAAVWLIVKGLDRKALAKLPA